MTAMPAENPLFDWLNAFAARYRAGERPERITSPFGYHEVTYVELINPDAEPDPAAVDALNLERGYATIGFMLPDAVYAEIEYDTYGQLQGLRVYLQEQ